MDTVLGSYRVRLTGNVKKHFKLQKAEVIKANICDLNLDGMNTCMPPKVAGSEWLGYSL